jgi:uncharacterized protein YjiS (DUF1127 family)
MTMLNFTPPYVPTAPAIRRALGRVLTRLGRFMNHMIAAEIARRARQADIIILRQLSDRELKDIGLNRGDIGEGLAEAARHRSRMQQATLRSYGRSDG